MSEVVILEECGHFMGIDKPEETAKCIQNFLAQNSDGEAQVLRHA